MFRFERLIVWQNALELCDLADRAATALPAERRVSLGEQLQRAARSVSCTIAEGTGRETAKDSLHFFTMAKASTFEVVSLAAVYLRRRLLDPGQPGAIYALSEEIAKLFTALKRRGERVPGGVSALGSRL